MGENFDPRKAPELTLTSTYNGDRQGLHILVYPSRYGMDQSFLNFALSFTMPHRLRPTPPEIAQWTDKPTGEPWDGYKLYWDALRFFGVDEARKVSPFESGGLVRVNDPAARVNVFARAGKVLLVIGYVPVRPLQLHGEEIEKLREGVRRSMRRANLPGGVIESVLEHLTPFMKPAALARSLERPSLEPQLIKDTVTLLDPKALGLKPGTKYQVQDLLSHRPVPMSRGRRLSVRLNTLWPQVLLIEPAKKAPRVAHFTGADGCSVRKTAGGLTCTLDAAVGSPVALYVDAGGKKVSCLTPGFSVTAAKGGFTGVAGPLPGDSKVVARLV
jgi:hypothetical protein